MDENKKFLNWSKIIDIFLILGIVCLASLDKNGWGWLVFLFFIKNW